MPRSTNSPEVVVTRPGGVVVVATSFALAPSGRGGSVRGRLRLRGRTGTWAGARRRRAQANALLEILHAVEHALAAKVNAEQVRQLLEEDGRQLQRPDEDLEVGRRQHASQLA